MPLTNSWVGTEFTLGKLLAKEAPEPHLRGELSKTLQLLIISDEKPGHENQSLGLAEAMARLMPSEIHIVKLDGSKGFLERIRLASKDSLRFPKPDYVIATGHSTHLSLLWLSWKSGARSILMMKPSLPVGLFDWCIAPEHDYLKAPPKNVITSKGALNRVVKNEGEKSGKLFLIGGPSKNHGYDEAALIEQITRLASGGGWQLADSRRTPGSFLPALAKELPGLKVFPHQETEPGWLAELLSTLDTVWVTEDSVSMIYEALSSGAKVGVLEMPRISPNARVLRGLAMLEEQGYFDWDAPKPLAEAERCAKIILRKRS